VPVARRREPRRSWLVTGTRVADLDADAPREDHGLDPDPILLVREVGVDHGVGHELAHHEIDVLEPLAVEVRAEPAHAGAGELRALLVRGQVQEAALQGIAPVCLLGDGCAAARLAARLPATSHAVSS
jgi:hypothetical protein